MEYPVERDRLNQALIQLLIDLNKKNPDDSPGWFAEIHTDLFLLRPFNYGWECTCGAERCTWECEGLTPTFVYHPTDFRLQWYKYPLRGTSANRPVTTEELRTMLVDCLNTCLNAA